MLSALVVAVAMAAFSASPATAQTATNVKCNGCVNSKDFKNNSLRGKDIKNGAVKGVDLGSNILLGTSGDDGDFGVKNTAGTATVSLDGETGDVTNSLTGNGLVKAWAKIAPDGAIVSCWRCNTDPAETRRTDLGTYEVDFTPLGTDISDRVRLGLIDSHDLLGLDSGFVALGPVAIPDLSSVLVRTFTAGNDFADLSFTLVIF